MRQYGNELNCLSLAALWTLFGAGGLAGCGGELTATQESDVAVAASALSLPDETIAMTLAPVRQLETPGPIYIKTLKETFPGTGTFAQALHVYQPDASGEQIAFELSATTSAGATDTNHAFQSVVLTSHPGQLDQSQQTLANAVGQRNYVITTSRAGWYRITFQYIAPNPNRTLTFRATDAQGNFLKTYWSDPSGANVLVRATVRADQASPAFLKGGAYRNAAGDEYAYIDNIKVDGSLLYRRGFDQGQFNYPLGRLSVADHSVEFSFAASGINPSYLWFGINDRSYDRIGNKTEWAAAQILYRGTMHTGDYDAWNEGVAFAQGPTLVAGVRPPPVRRGTNFALALEDASLNGSSLNASLRIYPFGSNTQVPWSAAQSANGDYTGGLWTAGGFSARHRELWGIQVPSDAAVGRYVVRAFSPNGYQIGQDVLFYVIHNPYLVLANGSISKQELETFAYDEDEDGMALLGNYGPDQDAGRDHFTALYDGSAETGFTPVTKLTAAFRRTHANTSFSMLDYAMAATHGTTTEFESMRRLYRVVSQRLRYNHYDIQNDSSETFFGYGDDANFTPGDAGRVSTVRNELLATVGGQCQDYGSILAALGRTSGIVSRVVSDHSGLGGWGPHFFTEAYTPNLPHHGGRTSPAGGADSDTDHWYVFDATDPEMAMGTLYWPYYGESIAPRAQYGRARVLTMNPSDHVSSTITTKLDWDPLFSQTVPEQGVLSVADAYYTAREYWLTSSGVTGWIGFGEKDAYRVNKEASGAAFVRVRTLPAAGTTLIPAVCVFPASVAPPLAPEMCPNPTQTAELPPGDSYVIVFNTEPDPLELYPGYTEAIPGRLLRGDTLQYALELENGSSACTEATAVDLGTPGTSTMVVNNGCLKITQYPSWWGTRRMQLQNSSGVYPVPFDVSNCGVARGAGTISADWQSFYFDSISQSCTTLIQLKGSGNGNLSLRYYAM